MARRRFAEYPPWFKIGLWLGVIVLSAGFVQLGAWLIGIDFGILRDLDAVVGECSLRGVDMVPNLVGEMGTCHFLDRCGFAHEACRTRIPLTEPAEAHCVRCVRSVSRDLGMSPYGCGADPRTQGRGQF